MGIQRKKAVAFQAYHTEGPILVLPNAWDIASARILVAAGARAIGTTSMGIAASMGLPDEECITLEDMLGVVERIASSVDVPVTADMETGYGKTPADVARSIERVAEAGAVGVNLEDGTGNPEKPLFEPGHLADRVRAAREAMNRLDLPLVINARTDVFLAKVGEAQERIDECLRRCEVYREAGADCFFIPGGMQPEWIQELTQGCELPINVVANPAISRPVVPAVSELERLGVRRVSTGSGLMRASLAYTQRASRELLDMGTYDVMRSELDRDDAPDSYRIAIDRWPN